MNVELDKILTDMKSENSSLFDENFEIDLYSEKLKNNAKFIITYGDDKLAGLVAYYANDRVKMAGFVSLLYVSRSYRGCGEATFLMESCLNKLRSMNFTTCSLEVHKKNRNAIALYKKIGFKVTKNESDIFLMEMDL